MDVLGVDLETFSDQELSGVNSVGSFRYIDSPVFEVLLFGYSIDGAPAVCVDFTAGETLPAEILEALYDPGVTKTGWNNAFERCALWKHFGRYCPPEQWEDTEILAGQCGLPMKLSEACEALDMPEDKAKMAVGKRLIQFFCKPCKPTKTNGGRTRNRPQDAPEDWETFKLYNCRDVDSEGDIRRRIIRFRPVEIEHRFWCLDARINERGMRIDRTLAENALRMDGIYKDGLLDEAVQLTGIANPKSVSQIKQWLLEQEGLEVPSLNKKEIAGVVANLESERALRFMALRREFSKSSTSKYKKMLDAVCEDGHIKGCFQFYGANRTGRFAGRLVQLQNLPQNHLSDLDTAREIVRAGDLEALRTLYGDVSQTLSELIRTAFLADVGQKLVVADFSAIEARVTAWLAGEEWRLEVFRNHGDIYCASASQMFKVPVVKHGLNGELRQKGKVAELALGYGGGINALKAFGADRMGMSEEDMAETVSKWREASPHVVELWSILEKAAIRSVVRQETVQCRVCPVEFRMDHGILWMRLPSGRSIAYWGAKYEPSRWNPTRRVLSYMGIDQKAKTKRWSRVETWGGKLTENCWAADTMVLTDTGWKMIPSIRAGDRVWDGQEFVECEGAVSRGKRKVIYLNGLRVTPEHRILTEEGWINAEACNGLDGTAVRKPNDLGEVTETGFSRALALEGEMRLRKSPRRGYPGHPESVLLRVPEETINPGEKTDARNVETPSLRGLAFDGSEMHGADASGLEELRGAWNHGLCGLDTQLQPLLGRHGADLLSGHGPGSKEQLTGVQPDQLPMGDPQNEQPKQAEQPDRRIPSGKDDCLRTLREDGNREDDAALSDRTWIPVRLAVRETECVEQVYDILNCGPRHRYVVLSDGGPILAHNCVQAIARDCLRETMLALEDAGFDIRAHVHDEIICTEPLDGRSCADMEEIMARPVPWAPGLPLRGEGFESPYYKKDD